MRGKAVAARKEAESIRITPAYAGKRVMRRRSFAVLRDHPRVCGEKWGGVLKEAARKGSPPRMRGKEHLVEGQAIFSGITPAYAGKRG